MSAPRSKPNTTLPPAWARRLAERLVVGPECEFVLGDLEQMYAGRSRTMGRPSATAWFVWAVLRTAISRWRREAIAGLTQDLRTAVRQFRRVPRVYVSAALVLTVGLGVATFAWGVYYAEHLRLMDVDGSERMRELTLVHRASGSERPDLSLDDLRAVETGIGSFDRVAVVGTAYMQYNEDAAAPTMISALRVSPSFFDLFEMRPALGRLFDASDAAPGAPRVAVLGHTFWTERYDRDPDVVGRSVRIAGEPTVIVGVLPEGARYLAADPLWLPAGAHDENDHREFVAIVRLAAGTHDAEAAASLRALSGGLEERHPEAWEGRHLRVVPFGTSIRGPHASTKVTMLGWTGVLLYLMAVANVANLFLVRSRVRARELAVRRALGASSGRVLRQLGIEAALPALLGLAGGAKLAEWALRWYRDAASVYGRGFGGPVWVHYGIETPHILVLSIGALASTVVVSLVAGAWALRSDATPLRVRGPGGERFRLGKGLLAIEVASGGALLLFSILLLTGTWNLRTIDYGFTTESILTGMVEPGPGYPDDASRLRVYEAIEDELAALRGVRSVTLATQLPMIRRGGIRRVEVDGWAWDGEDVGELPNRYADFVTPTFFETFERSVVRGRPFSTADDAASEPVAIVNEPFALLHFAGRSPIGEQVRVWNGSEPGPWRTVVGVAPHLWMDTDVNARPEGIYVPLAQASGPWVQIGMRVAGAPQAYADELRDAVARVAPELPITEVQTMDELIHGRTALYRFQSPPFIAVGLAALFLALVGMWAVVSYLASLRLAEFGICAAIGASRRELMQRAASTVVTPTVVGILSGIALGMYIVRGFDRWLFLVDPWSPPAIVATVGALGVSAVASALTPALRASRVDPAEVLKAE